MKSYLFILIFLLCFSGCDKKTTISKENNFELYSKEEVEITRNLLIGRWYGKKLFDDKTEQRWIMTRFKDGTYSVIFQFKEKNGQIEHFVEEGIWGAKKPIYFTAARTSIDKGKVSPTNTSDAALYDAYRILELTNEKFSYYSYSSGNIYTVKKVKDSFSLNSTHH